MGYGVIGSPTDSGSVSLGSSPSTPAIGRNRARSGSVQPFPAPLCSGLARRPLKAVARVRIPSGLPGVMSQDIVDGRTHADWVRPSLVSSGMCRGVGSVVALGWVQVQFCEEFSGGCVDDCDVGVLDEHEDAGSGVGSADADGVEPALVAQGDLA
jgi:hypothetical protein